MKKILTLTIACLILTTAAPLWATNLQGVGTTAGEFLRIAPSAQQVGRGMACVADATGVQGLYWNPAGLAKVGKYEGTFTQTMWIESMPHEYIGIAGKAGREGGVSVCGISD